MSVYYSSYRNMLVLKCDGCGATDDLYKGQTDRTLAHDWIYEHGWKTMKTEKGWQNVCPECKKALGEKKRQDWLKSV